MKITVEPGHVVRLSANKNSSSRGGTYDLAKLGLSEKECRRILACAGVSETKSSAKATTAKGDDK
jgi:hypothetical protein